MTIKISISVSFTGL